VLREAAAIEGVDPSALIAAASESMDPDVDAGVEAPTTSGPLRFERLLIGVLPYMTVNEVRAAAGFGPIAGGEVTTLEWAARYGAGPTAPVGDE